MSEYTPDVSAFRGVYGQMCAEWCRDDALAEFDRFIARTKAEALREVAYEFAAGPWQDQFAADGVDDDVSAVQSTYRWFQEKADRIERGDT